MRKIYDTIIIGAGIYGLYAAKFLSSYKKKVLIIERDSDIMERASLVNQARIHNGMHYPRGLKTIESILKYRDRFVKDFRFAINRNFLTYYAISFHNSLTDTESFCNVMDHYKIKYRIVENIDLFKKSMIDSVFLGEEYTFSSNLIKKYFLSYINESDDIDILTNTRINSAMYLNDIWRLCINGSLIEVKSVINATYASLNEINQMFNVEQFDISYELCEVAICKMPKQLQKIGITIMDGAFFSFMPFGNTEYHTLTSVRYTPHYSSNSSIQFPCMTGHKNCSFYNLSNCNMCSCKPNSCYNDMLNIYKKYIRDDLRPISHESSMFAIKAIMSNLESTDDRETRIMIDNRLVFSVLSGKFFTFYEMDKYLLKLITMI